ncbi:phospholipase D family protein [Variovorax humicola]|uniref:Phospholipase D family protein n=1 Tax=Variovorax humicola TaxID=1769758 RepID=A0ABU8VYD8_9BURK
MLAVALALLMSACASLPDRVERVESTALAGTESTHLGQALRAELAAHAGKSGIYPLGEARDAFAARILLAQASDRSLDLQYYIWHGDTTGQLLWQAIWQAAQRGVRVRMLLDDANTGGLDPVLAALDAHPNIEVRLFNPFANRGFRVADLGDFARLNRRMHNKSFTGDNQMTIVGGRNVGDEYYGADLNVGFQDLDVLAVGPVVGEVSAEFDRYWNNESAYPVASLLGPAPKDGATLLNENWQKVQQDPKAQRYVDALRQSPLVQQVAERKIAFEWTTAQVLSDDPDKVRFSPERKDLQMMPRLSEVFGNGQRELDLVSPYFVPGQGGADALEKIAARGVKVRVLTNSFQATDVAPVHAGYARYRKELLQSGVKLYELKPGLADVTSRDDDGRGVGVPGSSGSGGSSSASLHAKTFAVDRSRVFVGSFNLDPRSARLNTEMGVLIDSPALAQRLSGHFDSVIPDQAYQVRLQPDSTRMEWIDRSPAGETRYTDEPGIGPWQRLWINFLSILPIEAML